MSLEILPRATFQRAITAVRRALLPLPNDRIYEVDELGAFEIEPRGKVPADRRARPRAALPRFAPPAWQLHRRRFAELLAQGVPFSALEPALQEELASLATWLSVPAGASLFNEGGLLDSVYVVAQGSFTLSRQFEGSARSLGVARPGDALGVCSALGHYGALATARSRSGASVLKLPTACLIDVAASSPAFYDALARVGEARSRAHALAGSAFAELLGPESRAGLAGLFQRKQLSPGQALFAWDQNFLAIVDQGQLALSTFENGHERVLRTLARGQALGGVAGWGSLGGRPVRGLLRALEPTEVSVLDHDALELVSRIHGSLWGLPGLLHARGELRDGAFYALEGVRTAARLSWKLPLEARRAA